MWCAGRVVKELNSINQLSTKVLGLRFRVYYGSISTRAFKCEIFIRRLGLDTKFFT